jgi:hypothetical protein
MTVAVDGVGRYRWPVVRPSSTPRDAERPSAPSGWKRTTTQGIRRGADAALDLFTKIGHAIRHHSSQPPRQPGVAWLRGCRAERLKIVRAGRRRRAQLFHRTFEQPSRVLARNPRPRGNTAVARRAPLPNMNSNTTPPAIPS